MILYPSAKINIGLNIVNKRPDGYHELETIMVPVPVFDILELIPSLAFEWRQSGILMDGDTEDNLCIKAFRLIQSRYGTGNVYMHLRKQIPFGAGLGGGSADAAFVIKGLNELFDLKMSVAEQKKLAGQLGSDCPLFIENTPQLATGRGELLEPVDLDLAGYHLIIVKPDVHISTSDAYSGVHISGDKGYLREQIQLPITEWKHCIKNDFEQHIFRLYLPLESIKDMLYEKGALYASMSGSGSAVYGIFKEKPSGVTVNGCTIFQLTM